MRAKTVIGTDSGRGPLVITDGGPDNRPLIVPWPFATQPIIGAFVPTILGPQRVHQVNYYPDAEWWHCRGRLARVERRLLHNTLDWTLDRKPDRLQFKPLWEAKKGRGRR